MPSTAFGAFIKKRRLKMRVTLRDFCLKHGIDPGNYSRMERGVFPPPHREELLEKYAIALGFKRGDDDWIEFFDLAAMSRGQIPHDLLDDEKIVDKLPVLFRTIRGHQLSTDKLDELIRKIKHA